MRVSLITLGILVIGTVAAFAMSDYVVPHVWRYKITIEIETPEGIKTGSAIREVRAWKNLVSVLPDAPEYEYEVIGEAVVIDLGKRGLIFALINWSSREEILSAFSFNTPDIGKKFHYYDQLEVGMSAELAVNQPKIVAFKDSRDLSTAQLVYENWGYANEHVKIDNFKEIFGEGVGLKRVLIEISDEPIVWKMQKFLGEKRAIGPYEFVKGKNK